MRSSTWAWSGVGAGVCGLAVFMLTPLIADYPDSAMADNEVFVTYLTDAAPIVWATQVLTVLAAVLLVVFAAGLARRLSEQEPMGSLIPQVASAGVLLTAGLSLVGGGICTELFWHLIQDPGEVDPDTIAAALTIFNTMPWVWVAIGISAGATAVAALRHGSLPRWIGVVSVVMTALVVLTQVVPGQYMALLPGALWLIVAGIGFARRSAPTASEHDLAPSSAHVA